MGAPLPCEVLSCFLRLHSIEQCRIEKCAFRWKREAAEDRAEDPHVEEAG